jgi:hypothetical protein
MAERLKRADSLTVGICPHCENIHVYLFDRGDRVFAEAIVAPAEWSLLVSELAKQQAVIRKDDGVCKPEGHG